MKLFLIIQICSVSFYMVTISKILIGSGFIVNKWSFQWRFSGKFVSDAYTRVWSTQKIVLEFQEQDIEQHYSQTSCQKLKIMMKRCLDQKIRVRNCEVRNEIIDTGAPAKDKNRRKEVSVERKQGECHQWRAKTLCEKGDACNSRHDENKRGALVFSCSRTAGEKRWEREIIGDGLETSVLTNRKSQELSGLRNVLQWNDFRRDDFDIRIHVWESSCWRHPWRIALRLWSAWPGKWINSKAITVWTSTVNWPSVTSHIRQSLTLCDRLPTAVFSGSMFQTHDDFFEDFWTSRSRKAISTPVILFLFPRLG